MIIPFSALQAATAPGASLEGGRSPLVQIADRAQIPTSQDGEAFARAAAQTSPADVQSSLPSSSDGIGGTLVHQVEQMARHLSSLASDAPAPANAGSGGGGGVAGAKPPGMDRADTSAAVAQIERAYMFAIETTMASRGSTESTKIFNTLLKGQ